MDAFQAYKYYTAVKLHLTTDQYDVFKSNGRVSGSRSTFEKRNDRVLFQKIAQKFNTPRELIEFFVSNIAYGNTGVIYSTESDDYYTAWLSRKESRTAIFKKQMSAIYNYLEFSNLHEEDLYPLVPRFEYRKGDKHNPNQWTLQWLILNLWTLDSFAFMVDAEVSTHALYVGGIIPYLRFRIGFGDFWMYQWAYKLWRLTRRKPALKNEQGEYN